MPLPSTSDDLQRRALLLLLLLAREAELPVDQVDSARARSTVARGLAPTGLLRGTSGGSPGRPWMCRLRWSAS